MERPRLAVLGYLSIDEIVGPDAEPIASIGGGAIYAALSAARMGVDVVLHVCLGSNVPPAWIAELRRLAIDLSATEPRDHPTRRTRLSYQPDEQRRGDADRDAAWRAATQALQPPLPRGRFDGLLLCPIPLDLASRALRAKGDAVAIADTSEVFAAGGPAAMSAFSGVDIFAPSLAEARLLAGRRDDAQAMSDLAARVPVLVVKKGRAGLSRFEGGTEIRHRIDAIEAIDPTGAGDAAVGALAAARLLGFDPRGQLEAAAAAGRLVVGARGPAALGWRA